MSSVVGLALPGWFDAACRNNPTASRARAEDAATAVSRTPAKRGIGCSSAIGGVGAAGDGLRRAKKQPGSTHGA